MSAAPVPSSLSAGPSSLSPRHGAAGRVEERSYLCLFCPLVFFSVSTSLLHSFPSSYFSLSSFSPFPPSLPHYILHHFLTFSFPFCLPYISSQTNPISLSLSLSLSFSLLLPPSLSLSLSLSLSPSPSLSFLLPLLLSFLTSLPSLFFFLPPSSLHLPLLHLLTELHALAKKICIYL